MFQCLGSQAMFLGLVNNTMLPSLNHATVFNPVWFNEYGSDFAHGRPLWGVMTLPIFFFWCGIKMQTTNFK